MAIAFVQKGSDGRATGVTSSTSVLSSNPTIGNVLIAFVSIWNNTNNTTATITDSQGNTWTLAKRFAPGGLQEGAEIWSCPVTSTGATFTVTCTTSNSGSDINITAAEFSGVSATVDQTASNSATAVSGITVGPTSTLSSANELVAASLSIGTSTTGGASGYTNLVNQPNGSSIEGAQFDYKIVAVNTAVSAVYTGSGSGTLAGVIATFQASGGGAAADESIKTEDYDAAQEALIAAQQAAEFSILDRSWAQPLPADLAVTATQATFDGYAFDFQDWLAANENAVQDQTWNQPIPADAAGSTVTADGSASGVGTATGVGAAVITGAASSDGLGTAAGVGAATANSVGATSGAGVATGVGAATANSVGATSGVGTATGVSASTAAADGASSGTGTATGVGTGVVAGVASSAGTGTATGVGVSVTTGTASSSGTGSATGVGASTANSTAATSGVGAATGVGASTAASAASSAGVGAGTGVGASTASAVASSSGTGTALGVGDSIAAGSTIGAAAGVGTATGVGASIVAAVGNAAGTSTANAVSVPTVEEGLPYGAGSALYVSKKRWKELRRLQKAERKEARRLAALADGDDVEAAVGQALAPPSGGLLAHETVQPVDVAAASTPDDEGTEAALQAALAHMAHVQAFMAHQAEQAALAAALDEEEALIALLFAA